MSSTGSDSGTTGCVKFRNLFKPMKKWNGLPDCIRKVCSERDATSNPTKAGDGPTKPKEGKIEEQKEETAPLLEKEQSVPEEQVQKEGDDSSKEVKAEVVVEEAKPEVEATPEPEVEQTETKP